jgi:hypothetical protein
MDSFKKWLAEDADRNQRLDKQDRVFVKPLRDADLTGSVSPWHGQKKMKKR